MALQDPSTLECASRRRCIEKVEAPYYSPIKEYACGHRLVLFLNQTLYNTSYSDSVIHPLSHMQQSYTL